MGRGRPGQVYRVDIEALKRVGLVKESISIEGTISYQPCGVLEDIIHGIGWQCDRVGEFDVRPGKLSQLAMMDGMTTELVQRVAMCDKRQAQRYMHKLMTIASYTARFI